MKEHRVSFRYRQRTHMDHLDRLRGFGMLWSWVGALMVGLCLFGVSDHSYAADVADPLP